MSPISFCRKIKINFLCLYFPDSEKPEKTPGSGGDEVTMIDDEDSGRCPAIDPRTTRGRKKKMAFKGGRRPSRVAPPKDGPRAGRTPKTTAHAPGTPSIYEGGSTLLVPVPSDLFHPPKEGETAS